MNLKNKILFVCSGNTCRSPMAKFIFNNELSKNKINNFIGDSAGLYCSSGSDISLNSKLALEDLGITEINHYSKPVSEILFNESYKIICMTKNISSVISIHFPELTKKIVLLKNYSSDKKIDPDILDPFGGSLEIYISCRNEIHACINNIINLIKKNKI
jgi:protein-tyrosine-phosphatase